MRASPKSLLFILLTLWTVSVGAGFFGLWRFDATPGRAAAPATVWPAETHLARTPGQFTLVMLLHPNCPCSRASLEELTGLMARAGDRLTAYALFIQSPGMPADPATTDLWKMAAAIPHVIPLRKNPQDVQGFHAETSGTVCLYDPAGILRFQGGITSSRGHVGESAGGDSIESLLFTGTAAISQSPVYGCPLH